MALLVVLHPVLRKLFEYFQSSTPKSNVNHLQGDLRLQRRVSYDLFFSSAFIIALHGFSAPKVFLILYVNYALATSVPRAYIPVVTWTFNLAVLFTNEIFSGYPYVQLVQSLGGQSTHRQWAGWLDSHSGLIPRWEVLFNITVLRLISFNLDYYWSLGERSGSPVEV